jgi:hypothetical protein
MKAVKKRGDIKFNDLKTNLNLGNLGNPLRGA